MRCAIGQVYPAHGDFRGLIEPEYRLLGATVTATSQAGPKPGRAVPSGSYALELVPSGVLDAALSANVEVVTLEGGGIGQATQRWRYTGSTLRSWDPPAMISGWEFVERSTTVGAYIRPHVVRLPDTGRLVILVVEGGDEITVFRQTSNGRWLTGVTVEDTGDDTVGCLVPLSTGRLVALYTVGLSTSATQIRQAYSDDGGATWTVGSSACLPAPLAKGSDKYLRIRARELGGLLSVVLWESDTADVLYQYVSADQGATLDTVETISTTDEACPDLTVRDGQLVLATIVRDTARSFNTYVPHVRALSSASMPFSSVTAVDAALDDAAGNVSEWGTYAAGVFTSAECAIFADDDGDLWLYGSDHDATATREVITRRSRDGGVTWEQQYQSDAPVPLGTVVHWTGDTSTYMKDLAVAPERGRAALVHRFAANPGNADDSVCVAYLGGWSTVGMPEDTTSTTGRRTTGVAGWEVIWLPYDEPDNTGTTWARNAVGAPTSTLGATGITLTTAGGETLNYTANPVIGSALADGILAEFPVRVTSGTALLQVKISDGVNDYEVRVSVTTTTATLRDLNAGANIGSVACDGSSGVVVRIAIDKGSGAWAGNNGRCRAWVRTDGPYGGTPADYGPRADRAWTSIGSSTGLTAGASPMVRVLWGNDVSSTAVFRSAAYTYGSSVAGNIATSVNGDPHGRVLGGSGSPYQLVDGLRVHGAGGPTAAGESWTIPTDYKHPVTNLDCTLAPSPRRTWRSSSLAQQDIAWTGLDIGWRAGDAIGIVVLGTNVPTMTLYRDTGAANKVADLDFRIQGLAFTRSRGQLIPSAGGTAAPFPFAEGVLRGAHVDLGGGDVRKVRWNQAGGWRATGAPGAYASARIQLEAYDVADAASGTCDLWMPGGLFIVESLAATDELMLRIPVATVGENYYEIAKVIIGRWRVFQEYSYGRSVQFTPAAMMTTTPSGGRTVRALGPARRSVDIAWDDGIDTSDLYNAAGADFYTFGYTSANAIAAPADTPRSIAGVFVQADGARVPVVYSAAVPKFGAATTAAAPYRDLDPYNWLYSRIVSETLRLDTVTGHEMKSEVVKVGSVRLEEEL